MTPTYKGLQKEEAEQHSLSERKRIAMELQRREFWKASYIAAIQAGKPDPCCYADSAIRHYDNTFKDF